MFLRILHSVLFSLFSSNEISPGRSFHQSNQSENSDMCVKWVKKETEKGKKKPRDRSIFSNDFFDLKIDASSSPTVWFIHYWSGSAVSGPREFSSECNYRRRVCTLASCNKARQTAITQHLARAAIKRSRAGTITSAFFSALGYGRKPESWDHTSTIQV